MFIFHFTKQPNLAGTSLYALIIQVSRDLRIDEFVVMTFVTWVSFMSFFQNIFSIQQWKIPIKLLKLRKAQFNKFRLQFDQFDLYFNKPFEFDF